MNWPTLVCPEQLGGSPEHPILLGNRCRSCGEPFFPAARGCTRCSGTELERLELGSSGTIWSWTLQMFQPKTPYDGNIATPFRPFGVGYVQLASGLKVESRLVFADTPDFSIGQAVHLVLEPYRKTDAGDEIFTYAFKAWT